MSLLDVDPNSRPRPTLCSNCPSNEGVRSYRVEGRPTALCLKCAMDMGVVKGENAFSVPAEFDPAVYPYYGTYFLKGEGGRKLAISPHPLAPLFNSPENAQKIFDQIVREVASKTFNPAKADVKEHVRQLGFVSLWFLLKYVASYSGPYDLINDGLHLDMCNFRQSESYMSMGARAASFLFRGVLKSTIFSHGGNNFECLRWPDIRILLINATGPRAGSFRKNTQRFFDSNELVAYLWPEWVPAKDAPDWNDKVMVMPNRSKHFGEPTILSAGIESSWEGVHGDLEDLDDLVGLDEIDANRNVTMAMEKATSFLRTNREVLLLSRAKSRVGLTTTRFGEMDAYQDIDKNIGELVGWNDGTYEVTAGGRWTVYYRDVVENDKAILPEVMTKRDYEEVLRDDPWTALTQYSNKVKSAGIKEFAHFRTKKATLFFDEKDQEYKVIKHVDKRFDADEVESVVKLSKCMGVMTIDPASTKTGITSRTSRTSVGINFIDPFGDIIRAWERVGYFNVIEWIDFIFEGWDQFGMYLTTTIFEKAAMQKGYIDILHEEEQRRQKYISVLGMPARGDKVVRIRHTLMGVLPFGKLYLCEGAAASFIEEQMMFSSVSKKLDVLDEIEKAISYLVKPLNDSEVTLYEEETIERRIAAQSNSFGY